MAHSPLAYVIAAGGQRWIFRKLPAELRPMVIVPRSEAVADVNRLLRYTIAIAPDGFAFGGMFIGIWWYSWASKAQRLQQAGRLGRWFRWAVRLATPRSFWVTLPLQLVFAALCVGAVL